MKIVYSRHAVNDLIRLTEFLIEVDIQAASDTIDLIEEAINILERHPFIGRTVDEEIRELIISRGATGYVALYSVEQHKNAILILAIRHQREAGFNFNFN